MAWHGITSHRVFPGSAGVCKPETATAGLACVWEVRGWEHERCMQMKDEDVWMDLTCLTMHLISFYLRLEGCWWWWW